MSELVERQHYVPRAYLKNFGHAKANEYFIHVLARNEKTEDKIFETNTRNVALKKNLYTLPGETVAQKMAIEKFYSEELESHYNSVYEILTNPERAGVTDDERELIISTVVTMFYRTTRWISMHNGFMDQLFESMFQLCGQTGSDYFMFEEKRISIAGKTLKKFSEEYHKEQQPSLVLSQLETAMKLLSIRIKNDGIMVSKLEDENAEFITSDNPVIATNPGNRYVMPFDATNILRLPLDSKHMLLLMPYAVTGTTNLIVRKQGKGSIWNMQKLTANYQQMETAERFIFGTRTGLEGYLRTKEVSERPLIEEEGNEQESLAALIKKGKELGVF
jgi:hypothetical protein